MKRIFTFSALCLALLLQTLNLRAQFYGTVVDGQTGEPLPFVTAKYAGTDIGDITDMDGKFTVPVDQRYEKLEIRYVGYKTKTVIVNYSRPQQHSTIKLYGDNITLSEVVIKPNKKERYKRKENPAVELMRKVIAAKKSNRLENNDFYSYQKYEKHTFSVNEVSPKTFTSGFMKTFGFLKDHAEVCAETGKLILPLMVEENSTRHIYRKSTDTHKTIVQGKHSSGYNTIFSSGEFMNTFIKDIFTEVDIYKDNVRLLQHPFISPISTSQGIAFYHYYIMDTLMVEGTKCIDVAFVPNNSQDFGFIGHVYIIDDGSYQIKKSVLNISKNSGVNFVDNLIVYQDYTQLPNGQRALTGDNMIVEMKYLDGTTKLQVQRYTTYKDFSFEPITDNKLFKHPELETVEHGAEMRDSAFWKGVRTEELTETENSLDDLVNSTKMVGGYKWMMTVIKALVENSIELTNAPNKLDFIPVNSVISSNYVEGLKLKAGFQTSANLNPHLFFRGYYAYGFKDEKSKYKAEVEYSFNKKKYMAHEFPRRSVSASYMYDTMSPVEKFSETDKDNMYTSIRATSMKQMMYVRTVNVKWQYETDNNITFSALLANSNIEPAGKLYYQRAGNSENVSDITTTEAKLSLRYAPHETFINSKQKRLSINNDALILTLDHTFGMKAFGGDYKYNITEASAYKRFWLPYACGYLEGFLRGGVQWNKVPFPMLFVPSSNLSYFVQFDSWSFNMLENMEFLNDKYASLCVNWNLNGKLFNRVPLLKKLKWREYVGFKMMYGGLSDKNNPYIRTSDNELFSFPLEDGERLVNVMDKSKPYMEFSCGISNIFRFLTIEYVRRLNYYDTSRDIKKNGWRFAIDFTF